MKISRIHIILFLLVLSVTQAFALLTPAEVNSRTFTLAQRGNAIDERNRTRIAMEIMSIDATGWSIRPGQSVTVTIENFEEIGANRPRLALVGFVNTGGATHFGDGGVNGVALNQRTTTITSTARGDAATGEAFAIFFRNDFFPHQQGAAPIVSISGDHLQRHPIYIHGQTSGEFSAQGFRDAVNAQHANNGNNIAIAISENVVLSSSNTGARNGLNASANDRTGPKTMTDIMAGWEQIWDFYNFTMSGFCRDATPGTGDSPRAGRIVAAGGQTTSQNVGWAVSGITFYRAATLGGAAHLFTFNSLREYLIHHEVGHLWEPRDLNLSNGRPQMGNNVSWTAGEISNIVFQELGAWLFAEPDGRIRNNNGHSTLDDFGRGDPFGQGSLMQRFWLNPNFNWNPQDGAPRNEQNLLVMSIVQVLMAHGFDKMGVAVRNLRQQNLLGAENSRYNVITVRDEASSHRRWQNQIFALSNAVGYDLTEHFARFGVRRGGQAGSNAEFDAARRRAGVDLLPREHRMLHYLWTAQNRQPNSSAFRGVRTVSVEGTRMTLIGEDVSHFELSAFEVRRNGNVVQVVHPALNSLTATWAGLQAGDVVTAFDRHGNPHTESGNLNQPCDDCTSVSVHQSAMRLNAGESATTVITVRNPDGETTVASNNASVATATLSGNNITVNALSVGTATITVTNNGVSATINVVVNPAQIPQISISRVRANSWGGTNIPTNVLTNDGTFWHGRWQTGATQGSGRVLIGEETLLDMDLSEVHTVNRVELVRRAWEQRTISRVNVWVHYSYADLFPNGERIPANFPANVSQDDIDADFDMAGWVQVTPESVVGLSTTGTVVVDLPASVNARFVRLGITMMTGSTQGEAAQIASVRLFGVLLDDNNNGGGGTVSIRPNDRPQQVSRESVIFRNGNVVSDFAEIGLSEQGANITNLRIFDAIGNLVFEENNPQTPTVRWDLVNSAGRPVASGTYLVVVETRDISGRVQRLRSRIGVRR